MRDLSSRVGALLTREVLPPTRRHGTSLLGLSLIALMMVTAMDAVVWTYQSQRLLLRDEAAEAARSAVSRRQAVDRATLERTPRPTLAHRRCPGD